MLSLVFTLLICDIWNNTRGYLHMDFQKAIAFLSKYTTVTSEEVNDMLKASQFFTYEKNIFLMRPGEISEHLFFIISGSVRSYYVDNNEVEHTVGFVFEDQPLVDLNCFIKQTPTSLFAITMEPTTVIGVSHRNLFSFLEIHPNYETVLLNITAHFLSMHAKNAKLMRIPSAKDRYEKFVQLNGDVVHRVPLKYIASYLGMANETLSRVRSGKS